MARIVCLRVRLGRGSRSGGGHKTYKNQKTNLYTPSNRHLLFIGSPPFKGYIRLYTDIYIYIYIYIERERAF